MGTARFQARCAGRNQSTVSIQSDSDWIETNFGFKFDVAAGGGATPEGLRTAGAGSGGATGAVQIGSGGLLKF